jgi:signal peptide peptidase SppA
MLFIGAASSGKDENLKTTLNIVADHKGNKKELAKSTPAILSINFNGVIGTDDLKASSLESILVDSRLGDLKNNRVKGILLRINSPGGSAIDSDTIYRMLKFYKEQYKVPVHAYVDGLCASGAMFIACSCDYVSTTPSSIVGSVGVITGPFFNVKDTLTKWGILSETIFQGKGKDDMSPFKTWSPQEGDVLKEITAALYNRFITVVSKSRPLLTKEKLIEELGAHVFIAEKAKTLGYVDYAEDTYNNALLTLVKKAQINPDQPYQVVELKPKLEWLKDVFSNKNSLFSGKIKHEIALPEKMEIGSYLFDPSRAQ